MASRAEEYLQKAKECDEKAQAADHNDISNDFRTLAEHWRVLANIAARQAQLVDPLVKHVYADRRPVGFRGRNPTRQ